MQENGEVIIFGAGDLEVEKGSLSIMGGRELIIECGSGRVGEYVFLV